MVDNQHKQISGYRDLSQQEIDDMNGLKRMEEDIIVTLDTLIAQYEMYNTGQSVRWLRIAKTDIQTGFMAAIRAVAKPNGE